MTLFDILGRDLRVEWHEAIALLRDVVERAPQTGETIVPELHQVELLGSGQVEVHGGTVVADPVQRLGQMLQALLSRADPPVQLRLLIAQPQRSVAAYSEALAFFERPERPLILQALYNRATAALPMPDPNEVPASLSVASAPVASDKVRRPPELMFRPRRKLAYAAGILALVVALGAGVVFARRGDGGSPQQDSSSLGARVSNKVSGAAAAVGSAVSAIGARVGLTTPAVDSVAPAEVPIPGKPAVARQAARKLKAVSPSRDNALLQRDTLDAFDLNAQTQSPVQTESVVVVAEPATVPSAVGREVVLYSSKSKDVSAPAGLRPQLPKQLPASVRPEDLTRIELIILPDGTVDSVKLLDRPKDIHASMLLSAAKAWQFYPAMKDGVPVRYRTIVWIARSDKFKGE